MLTVKTNKLLYSAATLLAPALLLPAFMLFKRGRERWSDRLGLWNCHLNSSVWFHGASLGEMIGLERIAAALRNEMADKTFFGSVTSPTGLSKAEQFCSEARLLPFDHDLFFKKCIEAVNPEIFIFGETEIWPNLLSYLKGRKTPSVLVNGSISDNTFRYYKKLGSLVSESLSDIKLIFASNEEHAGKFLDLGATPEQIRIVTNTKYDQTEQELPDAEQKQNLKLSLFKNNLPLIIFSSLRPGEEDLAFAAIKKFQESGQQADFIIAPRHREKFDYFAGKLKSYSLEFVRRSQQHTPGAANLILLDTHGELIKLLPAADLAFVGGTLSDGYGGHNPLEAAQFGIALAIGPYHQGIVDVVKRLQAAKACLTLSSTEEIVQAFLTATKNFEKISEIGQSAMKISRQFAGSSALIAKDIISLLKEKES